MHACVGAFRHTVTHYFYLFITFLLLTFVSHPQCRIHQILVKLLININNTGHTHQAAPAVSPCQIHYQ